MKPRYLSLQPFLLWKQAERPIQWRVCFGREALLEVEIGFGNGEFLVKRAQTHPDHNFVGIELEWASVQRALRKIAQAQLPNVRLLLVDARIALERLFEPRSIDRFFSLFPCPWPKERHAKHRLFAHAFLQLLNSRLVNKGEGLIVTDSQPYFEWVLEQLPGTGFEVQTAKVAPRFSTKYERKWRERGIEQFYELRLLKREHLEVALKEDIALKTYRIEHFDPETFQPAGVRGEIDVEFKAFLYDPHRRVGMVRVIVVEGGLTQDFWIEIVYGEDGRWSIRPAPGCGFVPTVGVQRALDLVKEAAL